MFYENKRNHSENVLIDMCGVLLQMMTIAIQAHPIFDYSNYEFKWVGTQTSASTPPYIRVNADLLATASPYTVSDVELGLAQWNVMSVPTGGEYTTFSDADVLIITMGKAAWDMEFGSERVPPVAVTWLWTTEDDKITDSDEANECVDFGKTRINFAKIYCNPNYTNLSGFTPGMRTYVIGHEIGHVFGFGHHTLSQHLPSIMMYNPQLNNVCNHLTPVDVSCANVAY